ncbi:MAG: T9SS type A sorting domain-containing protein [Bacteroidales bacterium]|nr:T9SS type A sorting domain-containing protein [Bacteroidales bacterium]
MKDDSEISGANSSGFATDESGFYKVKVTENGCTGSSEGVQINYNSKPSGAFISALGDTNICEGASVILQLTTGTGYTYQWTNNDIPIAGASFLDYEAFESGVYRAEVTSNSCTIKSNPITVTVNHLPNQNGDTLDMSKDSLISWWPFDNRGKDESGNNNYASLFSVYQTIDYSGGYTAFMFNGINSYIATTKKFAHPDTFTVSLWFKTEGSGKLIGFDSLQYIGTSPQYDRHLYLDSAGHIYFGVDNGIKNVISTGASFNDNQWHMVTASLSPEGMKLYVDAKLLAENTSVINGAVYSGYWKMAYGNLSGWSNAPDAEYFKGKLDDIAIYNRALSIDEIEVLYNEQTVAIYTENNVICTTTGNTNIVIENSEPGIEYQLIKTSDNTPVGSAVKGNSGTIHLNTGVLDKTSSFKIFASNINTMCTTLLDSVYTVYVDTNVSPLVEINSNKIANEACIGDTVFVIANTQFAGDNPVYQWQINGINTGSDTSVFISNKLSDKDELKLILSSSINCASPKTVSSESLIFTIHSLPDNTITVNGSFDICKGDSTILSANANAGYEWYLIGEAYRLDTTQSLMVSDSGAYYLKLINQFGCISYSDTMKFNTYPLPEINIRTDTSIFTNQSVTIGTDDYFISYLWNTGASEQKITVDGSIGLGEHEFWQKVTDEHCSNTDTIIITIEQVTGIEHDFINNEIKVYPNPANEIIYIEFTKVLQNNLIVEMRNSVGMLVWYKVYKQNNSYITDKIRVDNYPKGIYFLNFKNENHMSVHKIIIE